MTNGVYSDFEVDEVGIKFAEDQGEAQSANCVGSCEEEMESKTVTKSCRGVVIKERTRGTGKGTLKLSWHIPWAIYTKFFGMDREDLIDGVKGYGKDSVHKEFLVTMHITDEDGVEKLKAYPKCRVASTGPVRKIENGAEEVAEFETEISVTPDEYGYGLYEALVTELKDESVKETWMKSFTPALVQIASA